MMEKGGQIMQDSERFKTFTVLIAKISRSIRRIKTEEMAGFDLKSPHVSCLYYLYTSDSRTMTAKELCDICDEDKAAVSRSIDYLESNGYLSCDSQKQKRYKSLLVLTEKGREIGKYLTEKVNNILDAASRGLSDDDRRVMYRSLALISSNLRNICGAERTASD